MDRATPPETGNLRGGSFEISHELIAAWRELDEIDRTTGLAECYGWTPLAKPSTWFRTRANPSITVKR